MPEQSVVTIGSPMSRAGGEDAENGAMQAALLAWYAQHRRPLPWRRNRDPYRIWVSEIMLQQTRVAAVLEHYGKFLRAFPSLEALALAPVEQVLARWSGLGYYRRARRLHQAAQVIVRERAGRIPRTAEELRKLPGVGRYTAAAIASIAFGAPDAVVDGNVERVLGRLEGKPHSGASAWKRAQGLLALRNPGDWNQAMMELGATLCTPQNPQCGLCPLRAWCLSQSCQMRADVGPVRAPGAAERRTRPARKRVQSAHNWIARGDRLYLVQRAADAAKMAGMWELPECVAARKASPDTIELCVLRHSITDTDYAVRVLRLGAKALSAEQRRAGRWVKREDLFDLPLTGLTRKVLRRLAISGGATAVVESKKQL
jgi:A/G-specific adenine glycosylase